MAIKSRMCDKCKLCGADMGFTLWPDGSIRTREHWNCAGEPPGPPCPPREYRRDTVLLAEGSDGYIHGCRYEGDDRPSGCHPGHAEAPCAVCTVETEHAKVEQQFHQGRLAKYKLEHGRTPSNRIAALKAVVAELKAQLDKWPRTKDGVAVYPNMTVWPPETFCGLPPGSHPGPDIFTVWPIVLCDDGYRSSIVYGLQIQDCYSSSEAAVATRKDKDDGDTEVPGAEAARPADTGGRTDD